MLGLDPLIIQIGIALTVAGWFFLWNWDRLATRPVRRRRHHAAR